MTSARRSSRLASAAAGCALAALLAGCSAGSPTAAGTNTASPAATGTSTPSATLDCNGILPADTVADFTSLGWVARQDPFYVDDIELPGGIQCIWGDPAAASDNVQVYGWAPLTPELAQTVRKRLDTPEWSKTEEDDADVFASKSLGVAYRVDDDSIAVSDTKDGLLLVSWPPAG